MPIELKTKDTVLRIGFPPPLLVRGTHAAPIAVSGVPLGLFPDSVYEPVCLALQPGDVVVFCSDGIHEQTNAVDEESGVARLVTRLAGMLDCSTAKRIASDILKVIDEYAGDGTDSRAFRDDRTIVVLRVADVEV